MNRLVDIVGDHVSSMLEKYLPSSLLFHNLEHTRLVVEASKVIGRESDLSDYEMEVLLIAAWFHDTGYMLAYQGHEDKSIQLAEDFLQCNNCTLDFLSSVVGCIQATEYPQYPRNPVEKVLCDADMYHFTRPDYPRYAGALREELQSVLNRVYSDQQWNKLNYAFFSTHKYWTPYGQSILNKFKMINQSRIEVDLSKSGSSS